MQQTYYFLLLLLALIGYSDGSTNSWTQSSAEIEDEPFSDACYHGEALVDGTCDCPDGWKGCRCEHCQGRFIESNQQGYISDGNYNYQRFINCSFYIKRNPMFAKSNTTLKLTFDETKVSCDGVSLRVYDGDGEYAPLLAVYSGAIRPSKTIQTDVIASSGTAFLKFRSLSPVREVGYTIFYQHIMNKYEATAGETPSASSNLDSWSSYVWRNLTAQGRASAGVTAVGEYIYVYGGYIFGSDAVHEQMLRFTIANLVVDPMRPTFFPKPRHGHTMVAYKDTLLVYGGIVQESYAITNELWSFNTTSEKWTLVAPSSVDSPPSLVGHSAHVAVPRTGFETMVVIFGYHPRWRYSNFVFHYDIANNKWTKAQTTGALPIGAYGHASALDHATNRIYVTGGLKDKDEELNNIYVYDVELKSWEWLTPVSSVPRYLHSMVFIDNALFVYGGRSVKNIICEDVPFETYNLETNVWKTLPTTISAASGRFGHSSVAAGRSMFVYGGFDGIMHSDALQYFLDSRGNCSGITSEQDCNSSTFCAWTGTCEELLCNETSSRCGVFCELQESCVNCLSSVSDCCSCAYDVTGNICLPKSAMSLFNTTFETNITYCEAQQTLVGYCATFENCFQCNEAQDCSWSGFYCKPGNRTADCGAACTNITSCDICTLTAKCSWCATTKSCFATNDGDVFFPYGTCTDPRGSGKCGDTCNSATFCDSCFEDTGCGWCATDVQTGLGSCMSGSVIGPRNSTCDRNNWFFNDCPDCQCNGHSACINESVCDNCTSNTDGQTCDECDIGFYGNPTNGGNCSACECNEHADTCESDGICNCLVYGMEGSHCERCSDKEYITGDPLNGTCYYEIAAQFRYDFNFQFVQYTQMNFDTCPSKRSDLLLAVSSLSVSPANSFKQSFDVIIAYNSSDSANETIFREYTNKTYVQVMLRQSTFNFGKESQNCIRIYTTFKTPFHFSISLVHTYTNIGILLGAFFTVFIVLLIIAIIFWKVNTMWMRYQMRRNRQIELQEMASRPLACVDMECSQNVEEEDLLYFGEESLDGGIATVASVLMWMPCGDSTEHKPSLAIGSTLMKTTPSFKEKARLAIAMKLSRSNLNRESTIGIDNPVLELDSDIQGTSSAT